MKKLFYVLFAISASVQAFAQVAWIEPEPTIATDKITIYVDLSKLDVSQANNEAMAAYAGPMYLWTWKPADLGATNGTWDNSNEGMVMTQAPEKGEKVWKFEMIPTDFYKVEAAAVYENGLAFLVKAKDGSGSPEKKTNDFNIPVVPPSTNKGALYKVPSVLLADEITTIVYDNAAEKQPSMQHLTADTVLYTYLKATAKDTATGEITVYEPSKFFAVPSNPNLLMPYAGGTQWKLSLVPRQFFGVPANLQMVDMTIWIRKKDWTSDKDTSADKPVPEFGCE